MFLIVLSIMVVSQSTGTNKTAEPMTQVPNYCADYSSDIISYSTSAIIFGIHSGAS